MLKAAGHILGVHNGIPGFVGKLIGVGGLHGGPDQTKTMGLL
jgi:hypothetical protein